MSKIICDVCGTSYPDSVNQCPICGCVRAAEPHTVSNVSADVGNETANGGYTHVRGGRFSKSNVKKRNAKRSVAYEEEQDDEVEGEVSSNKADRGLLVAFIVLLLSVIAVVCYILVKLLSPDALDPNAGNKPGPGDLNNDQAISTEDQTNDEVPCEGIVLTQDAVSFDKVGTTYQLEVTFEPADTTDTVSYASGDTNVATVTDEGLITVVGDGETTITITCGAVEKTVKITCTIKTEETTAPTLPTVPNVDLPSIPSGFELNRSDFTLFKKGESWTLYSGSIPSNEITWTSSDPKVATVSKGKVTAVSAGRATITAEYKGAKLTCTVRCKDSVGAYVEPAQTEPTEPTVQAEQTNP